MEGIKLKKIKNCSDLYYFVKNNDKNTREQDQKNKLEVPSTKKEILYKYMSFNYAIDSIKNQYLHFQEPSKWKDGFEKLYYDADYSNLQHFSPYKLYATCFTTEEKRESGWKAYSEGDPAVQFTINRQELRRQLQEYIDKNHTSVDMEIEGKMIYKDEKEILRLYKKHQGKTPRRNRKYPIYFPKSFDFDDFMYLLCLKRSDFKEEQEVRFFLRPTNQKTEIADSLRVKINLSAIIKKIRLSPDATEKQFSKLKKVCQQCGLKDINIEHYKLYDNPNGKITIDAPDP